MQQLQDPSRLELGFVDRHLGSDATTQGEMLRVLGFDSLDALAKKAVPASIFNDAALRLPPALSERDALAKLREIASLNRPLRSLLGLGYSDCFVPPVIARNILENPGWYTQYTPYQAEISQGRLEALLNFQTMVSELTALPLSNASLLDEGTAAGEAMTMCRNLAQAPADVFFVADNCHPQTIAVLQTRAEPLGISIRVGDATSFDPKRDPVFGAIVQYPATDGSIHDYRHLASELHAAGALLVMATDPLALTLLVPPGEVGADIAVGSTQRFGVPLGYGGPHAAFLSTREDNKRHMPGRIVGVSRDVGGELAYRLAIQTREQHIRRDKATSNICTAQVLLAIMASMYAVYHGEAGLTRIARRVRDLSALLRSRIEALGFATGEAACFDTLYVRTRPAEAERIVLAALSRGINLRSYSGGTAVGIALDETSGEAEVRDVLAAFGDERPLAGVPAAAEYEPAVRRVSPCLTHPIFARYHSEHELLRYIHRLQHKDLSLTTSMIPLGSCTMKLNATAEMLPISWPEFSAMHPFAPADQARGYARMLSDLESWLAEITGMAAVSLQPNAGSQGEYAGLLAIRAYHRGRGDRERTVCLIPKSAHGTNPASAVIAGFRVIVVECDASGNIDLDDLTKKIDAHQRELGALMVTYPSTHGVFEDEIKRVCALVHEAGGQVYLDGANMNAQVGLCRPAEIGADVCHLNLHKTFCIPHGGGGPGMGPIAVAPHLAPFLPGHPLAASQAAAAIGPIASAPYGSASILAIPWMYIAMMGPDGLKRATQVAILNANYMAARLKDHYRVLYTGSSGLCAHEFIIDARPFKQSAAVEVEDIAKRLIDFGFHAPTMSFPVAGTLMIEPTESESKAELDRLCEALIIIAGEVERVASGEWSRTDNPLKHAPHPATAVTADTWSHAYPRSVAAYPAPWLREHKYWSPVRRVDNAYGDRNLVCTCPLPDSYAPSASST